MIFRSEYVNKIMTYADAPLVKILTGVRRCRKSIIMKMLMEEIANRGIDPSRIIHYSFDSLD